ncbi:MAG TPA: SDR family oxidoreductase [Ignavibacteriaceae bacterium]|nr:SDR family oxidoreductase [Ignavibacteriaceae bacterium]
MKNKTCIVTGSNTGIGKATAAGLASLGAEVIMVCRNKGKGEAARKQIIRQSRNQAVHLFIADLSAMTEVRNLSKEIHSKFNKIDVLINNAGIITIERQSTVDGYEYQFAVNYLSNFLLVHLLLDLFLKDDQSRIINVSSGFHRGAGIKFDDLQSEKEYNSHKVYGMTKLAQIIFTYKLSKLLDGKNITVNSLHPGVVATHLLSDFNGQQRVLGFLNRFKNISPEKGAGTSIYLASSDEVEKISGKYFVNKKMEESSLASYDPKTADRLWDKSLKLCGISDFGI